jgi:hypothetical protein
VGADRARRSVIAPKSADALGGADRGVAGAHTNPRLGECALMRTTTDKLHGPHTGADGYGVWVAAMGTFVTGRRRPRLGCEPPGWRNAGHTLACYIPLTLGNRCWTVISAGNLIGTTCVREVAPDCLPPLLSPGPLSRSGHGWMRVVPRTTHRVPPLGIHAKARPPRAEVRPPGSPRDRRAGFVSTPLPRRAEAVCSAAGCA